MNFRMLLLYLRRWIDNESVMFFLIWRCLSRDDKWRVFSR